MYISMRLYSVTHCYTLAVAMSIALCSNSVIETTNTQGYIMPKSIKIKHQHERGNVVIALLGYRQYAVVYTWPSGHAVDIRHDCLHTANNEAIGISICESYSQWAKQF